MTIIKKIFLLLVPVAALLFSCNKANPVAATDTDFKTLEKTVLTDFTNNVALGGYLKLSVASANLNSAIQTLNATPTDATLQASRDAWKNMRETWEQCEGFLFGPVEDNDYDPNMDTWPTDYAQMDSLLASNNELEISDIQNFTLSLRGYHPIEYIIFGNRSSRKGSDITARQKKYMVSLSTDLMNTCNALYLSWASAPENFAVQVTNAGDSSAKYATRQEVFMSMADGLIDICDEVGDNKMKVPYDAKNPAIVESPYSGNSTADFRNNIISIQNVYLGLNGGKGLKDLVAAKNKSLDNAIQTQISAAIGSFSNITVNYEDAIISQRTQVQQTMNALATLKSTLESELVPFIKTNIAD